MEVERPGPRQTLRTTLSTLATATTALRPQVRSLYADVTRRHDGAAAAEAAGGVPGPEVTTAAIVHAITSAYPRPRYVVAAAEGLGLLGSLVPAWLLLRLQWALPTPAMDRLLLRDMERRARQRLHALPARHLI